MAKLTKAIVLKEIDFRMLVSDLLDLFINNLDIYTNEHELEITEKEAKELYEQFKNFLYDMFEFILDSENTNMMIIYYNEKLHEIYRNNDFLNLVLKELEIYNYEDLLKKIEDYTSNKITVIKI